MFSIKINEALLYNLVQYDVKIEEFIVIACLNLGHMVPLRVYLRQKNNDQMLAFMQPFVRKMLVKQLIMSEEFSWDNYELTEMADQLFEECSGYITEDNKLEKEPVVPKDSVTKLVEDYLALFPEGVRNAGGDYLKGNAKDVAAKMNTFVSKYKYPEEVILGATTRYVKQQAREQHRWCSTAHFFISKNGVSKLATECEAFKNVKDGGNDNWRDNLM